MVHCADGRDVQIILPPICLRTIHTVHFNQMMFTRRRKIYAGILAVAVAALLVDRLVIGPGTPASARAAETRPDVAGYRDSQPPDDPMPAIPVGPDVPNGIAESLAALAKTEPIDLGNVRDAFRAPPAWMAQLRPQAEIAVVATTPADAFRRKHKLWGIKLDERGDQVIVDGDCLEIGEQLDGFTLKVVGKGRAVFANGDTLVELVLVEAPQEENEPTDQP